MILDEFLPSKMRTLGAVGRFWAKIDHGTPLESIFWKNHFLIIFDFSFVGLGILPAEFLFIRPNIGRSVIFLENIPIKVLSPRFFCVNSTYFSVYLYFCEFSPNSIFYNILRLGEEFLWKKLFTRWKSMKFGLSNAVSNVSLRLFNPEIS